MSLEITPAVASEHKNLADDATYGAWGLCVTISYPKIIARYQRLNSNLYLLLSRIVLTKKREEENALDDEKRIEQ